MDFSFTSEQKLLQRTLEQFFADEYSFNARRAAAWSPDGWRPEIWSALAKEIGILGAGVPSQRGGMDGGPVEHMIIMEEFGRALVLEPYVETIVIGAGLLSRAGEGRAAEVLAEVIEGRHLLAFAWAEPSMRYALADIGLNARRTRDGWRLDGKKSVVTAAPWADSLIVAARTRGAPGEARGLSLFLIDGRSSGLTRYDYPTADGRRASDLIFEDVPAPADALLGEEGEALSQIEDILDRALAAISAEAVGAMRTLHAHTLEYTAQRRQFGQPLAAFQALQHRMVDMLMQIEMATSASYLATLRLDAPPAERARAASSAKVTVAKASRFVGQNAVQLHGGMGVTDELPVGHYFKRLMMIEAEFGDVDHHLARHATLSRARR
jgi:alkylation response protein AidB-like acyl-CoA dehydrogenase